MPVDERTMKRASRDDWVMSLNHPDDGEAFEAGWDACHRWMLHVLGIDYAALAAIEAAALGEGSE